MNGARWSPTRGGHAIVDSARCHGCAHPARIHNAVGCVSGPCECLVTRAELMPDAPRLEVPDGIESTAAVKAAPVAEVTGPAPCTVASDISGVRVLADPPDLPRRQLPAWDPPKLPAVARTPVASGGFVRWEPVPATVHATPEPPDFGPLLAAALHVSARWYCPACHQWPINPGACPGCRKPLQPVHTVTIPRSLT